MPVELNVCEMCAAAARGCEGLRVVKFRLPVPERSVRGAFRVVGVM